MVVCFKTEVKDTEDDFIIAFEGADFIGVRERVRVRQSQIIIKKIYHLRGRFYKKRVNRSLLLESYSTKFQKYTGLIIEEVRN